MDKENRKISLILGSHAHLSPSAGDDAFEEIYSTRLKPFITALNQHPRIQAAIHYSGSLLGRMEQKTPEFFLLIKELVARKQIEVLGGGFYEPLLPLIPSTARIGQIELLTTYVRQNFGRKPQGCRLARDCWEQSLVGVLNTCGMVYTFLSEEQFAAAGRAGDALYSPVITEDQGKIVTVFPVFSSLAGVDFAALRGILSSVTPAGEAPRVLTVFPDFSRNKAGTAEDFFSALAAALLDKSSAYPAIEAVIPNKIYRIGGALPRVYFPHSCDLPGLQPRTYLTRYPEAADLYARIYFTHSQIDQLRGDKSRKHNAREELWKAQGAETFCGGAGQNISSFAVRSYSYRTILAAERITREKDFKPSLLSFDFTLDRTPEYLFQEKNINCYVRSRGAAVFELDYLPKSWNYLNTFSGNSQRRCAFIDMLLPGGFIPSGPDTFPGESRFCGDEEYEAAAVDKQKLKAAFVLRPQKNVPFGFIEIQKTYRLEKNSLHLFYVLRNRGEEKTILCFVPLYDFSFAGEGEQFLFRKTQGEECPGGGGPGEIRRFLAFEEQDPKHGASLSLTLQMPCDLYYYPVHHEGGYQSTCFLPVFQLFLNPGDEWENRITVILSSRASHK